MDGNRRWARKRKLPVLAGHHKGAGRIEALVEYAVKREIKYVTFWAFSSENWERGEVEVGFLMRVFRDFIKSPVVSRMVEKGVRVKVIGDFALFPKDIVKDVNNIVGMTKDNTVITAIFALNYGGRQEILKAVNEIVGGQRSDGIIDEKDFLEHLYTNNTPDPDVIVRTGGEKRLSGFLPWQSVYSEIFFVDTLWPDFGTEDFQEIIDQYYKRERRFGK